MLTPEASSTNPLKPKLDVATMATHAFNVCRHGGYDQVRLRLSVRPGLSFYFVTEPSVLVLSEIFNNIHNTWKNTPRKAHILFFFSSGGLDCARCSRVAIYLVILCLVVPNIHICILGVGWTVHITSTWKCLLCAVQVPCTVVQVRRLNSRVFTCL